MKKNNKGFFLAETIVMIALITTVVAFLYPNVSKLYENFNNRVKYHDQTEDLYTLRAVYDYMLNNGGVTASAPTDDAIIQLSIDDSLKINDLEELYITRYMASPKDETNYEFNKYLHRLKKTHNDPSAYRLIGKFSGNRYASIKVGKFDIE